MKTKRCTKCKKEKDISEFRKRSNKGNSLVSWCKECCKEYAKEYYKRYNQINKEKIKKYQKKWRMDNPVRFWCQGAIISHKRRGYKVLFKAKELLQIAEKITHCPFCDIKLRYSKKRNKSTATIDRVNNENFLTLDNIQILCWRCNITKSDRTMKEFINYCKKILSLYS